jgi:hypothetical protein
MTQGVMDYLDRLQREVEEQWTPEQQAELERNERLAFERSLTNGSKVRAFGRTWTVKKVTAKMALLTAPKLPKLPAAEKWAYLSTLERVS